MYKLLGLKRKYFGYYPFVNILVSRLIFRTLKRRSLKLKSYWTRKQKNAGPVKLVNDAATTQQFLEFHNKGFDKLNIGGGSKNLAGFINLDFVAHKTIEREVVANITDLSFIPDGSCSHIHSNHVMEHLSQQDFEKLLRDCLRILKPGGIVSIRCPNVLGVSYGFFFDAVAEKGHEEFLALGYPKEEEFYNPKDNWYYQDLYAFYHWVYAYTGNRENEHLNQFTPTKLKNTVEEAGFQILKMTEPETSNLVLMAKKP